MLPFNPIFRHLLRRFIPKLSNENLDKHERLVALRHQLIQERNILDRDDTKLIKRLKLQIEQVTIGSNKILEPFKKDFKEVQELYVERRRTQLTDNEYLQLPTSPLEVSQVVWPNIKMRWRGFKLFWVLFIPRRIKHSTISQKVSGVAVTAILASSIYLFNGSVKKQSAIAEETPKTTPLVETQVLPEKTIADVKTGSVRTVITTVTTITTKTQTPTILTAADSTQTETTKQGPDVAGKIPD